MRKLHTNNKLRRLLLFVYVWHQDRLAHIESEMAEEAAQQQQQDTTYEKQRVDAVEQRCIAPVDDSKEVEGQSTDLIDGSSASYTFQVCCFCRTSQSEHVIVKAK